MKHRMRWVLKGHRWVVYDGADNELEAFDFGRHVPDGIDGPGLQALAYGVKQLVADGGADAKGTPLSGRLRGMRERFAAWGNGTYSFRDGTGASAARLPDAAIYFAAVRAGLFEDTAERRAAWARVPAVRARLAAHEAVRAELARTAPEVAPEEAEFFGLTD